MKLIYLQQNLQYNAVNIRTGKNFISKHYHTLLQEPNINAARGTLLDNHFAFLVKCYRTRALTTPAPLLAIDNQYSKLRNLREQVSLIHFLH